MVDIPSLEDAAKQRAIDHVTRLLEVPENQEKLDMLRMKARRQCETTDAHLKSAMQSQLEDIKTGLEQLHGCVALTKEVHSNFGEVRTLYLSVSSKAHDLDVMRPVADKRGRLAKTLEHIKHVAKVDENIKKIELCIGEDKLLNAHKLLSELEVSRDEVMISLAKEPTANADDLNMIKKYFAAVEQQANALEKRISNYMSRLIATCKANPVIIVSCLRVVEREELLDEEYEARSKEDSYKFSSRPKRWRETLIFSQIANTVKERIYGLQTETRETKDFWLSLYLENVLHQFHQDVTDMQNLCVPCFPPKYEILERFIRLYHTSIADRLLELYKEGMQDKECLSLLHWIHQRYYGPDGLVSPKLRLPSKLMESLPPLLPEDIMEQCKSYYLDSTKANIKSWLRTCLEKNCEFWRTEVKPDFDINGFALTNIPIDVFQMFRETVKEARGTVGSELTYEIIEACVDQLEELIRDLFTEVNKYRALYMKIPKEAPHFALYNIAVANSCDMFVKFLGDMIADYRDVISYSNDNNPFGTTVLTKVENVNENLQMLPDAVINILGEMVFRDLAQIMRYLLTRDKWFVVSVRCGTICGTIEDYWHDSFVHMKPIYYRVLISSLQEKIIAQYLAALNPPRIKLREDEFASFSEKLREDGETYSMFFDSIDNGTASPGGETGFDSPFRIFESIADLLTTPCDSDSMMIVVTSFVKRYPDVPEALLTSILVFRGISLNEARVYVDDAKKAFPPGRNNPSGVKFRKIFALMSQPLPSSGGDSTTLTSRLASVVSTTTAGAGSGEQSEGGGGSGAGSIARLLSAVPNVSVPYQFSARKN